jgi:hypothetical protein
MHKNMLICLGSPCDVAAVAVELSGALGSKAMNESEYYAGEFADADLDALADAGELYLEESGFFLMPTQEEMRELAKAGETLLFIDWVRTV